MRSALTVMALICLAVAAHLSAAPVFNPSIAESLKTSRPQDPKTPVFSDVTAAAGIRFVHNSGRTGRKWLPETLGSGVAFFDANEDGWIDLFFVNGRDWEPGARRSLPALYRNNAGKGFTDVTAGSGLDVVTYGIGVAAGDYDNDGRADLYVTSLDGDRLFHNEGAVLVADRGDVSAQRQRFHPEPWHGGRGLG